MRYRVRLPQATPYAPDPWWYQPLLILRDLFILLSLIIGAPFLVWLIMSPRP